MAHFRLLVIDMNNWFPVDMFVSSKEERISIEGDSMAEAVVESQSSLHR